MIIIIHIIISLSCVLFYANDPFYTNFTLAY